MRKGSPVRRVGQRQETASVRGTQADRPGGRLWENPHLLLHVPTESQICPTLVLQCVFTPNRQSPLTEGFFPLILWRLVLHQGGSFRESRQTAALLRCLLNIIIQLSFFINGHFFSACCSKNSLKPHFMTFCPKYHSLGCKVLSRDPYCSQEHP